MRPNFRKKVAVQPVTPATVIAIYTKFACGMKYHGDDPKSNLCANHSPSCESRKKVSMCFSPKSCEVCGLCWAHCVGHLELAGWGDPLTRSYPL